MKQDHRWIRLIGKKRYYLLVSWGFGIIVFLNCRFVMDSDEVLGTLVSVKVEQTQLAGTVAEISKSTIIPTMEVSQATEYQVPDPPQTVSPTLLIPTGEQLNEGDEVPDLERRKKAANILLFENMSASGYVRYVMDALDQDGYFYLDVGSATGWFRTQLLSSVEWDLIIAAAEARRDFGGDFFELIDQSLQTGSAAIIEYWDLDFAPNGKVNALLDRCGVKFFSDWFKPELRVFFWLVPDHPVFNEPNDIPTLQNATRIWKDDIGDLLAIRYRFGQPEGDAVILAGTNPGWKTDHGTLVSCIDGRLILQTFSTHEYQYENVIRLWKNYIHNALKNRFRNIPSRAPTPVHVMATQPPSAPTPIVGPLPSIDTEFDCGGVLTGKLSSAAHFQRQLFEHNAGGEFLIVNIQLNNISDFPIQIWDGDYSVEGIVDGIAESIPIQKAATGYLYIENPKNLWQGLIDPGSSWRTSLAFDVEPNGKGWTLVIKPGFEFGEQICELRIPLTR